MSAREAGPYLGFQGEVEPASLHDQGSKQGYKTGHNWPFMTKLKSTFIISIAY